MNDTPRNGDADLDARLRAHLGASADRLVEPPERLAAVHSRARRRQTVRGALAAVALVALVALPVAAGVFDRPSVVIEPGPAPATPSPDVVTDPPAPSPAPTPAPTPTPTGTPDPGPTPTPPSDPSPETGQRPSTLPAATLTYRGAAGTGLERHDRSGTETLWPDPVVVALPDGRGGVLLQPEGEAAIVWLPAGAEDAPVRLVEVEGDLLLRGLTPDGDARFSVRPPAGTAAENDTEEFFVVPLAEGASPHRVAAPPAYETWTVGPVAAADGLDVHASCHAHCSLWPGQPGGTADGEVLYHGGGNDAGPVTAIEGLTAAAEGLVLGFVEFDPVMPDLRPVELVLLDGASFEVLARVPIPLPEGAAPGTPTVSLSADGQRALVTVGGEFTGAPPVDVPQAPFVVYDALTPEPRVYPVDSEGVLRWADPVAASGTGGPVTEDEWAVAEALIAFAEDPALFEAVPWAAEVELGLGEDILGPPRPASQLADVETWQLEPDEGHFRAYVGPFSALDVLAGADGVSVSGGPHAHCANPPITLPPEVEGLRQVSVQPVGIDSCLQWFAVDLFLDDAGDIAAVTLDLWEP